MSQRVKDILVFLGLGSAAVIICSMVIGVWKNASQVFEENIPYAKIEGTTMGTVRYTVKVVHLDSEVDGVEIDSLTKGIEEILVGVNQDMSTYIADSQISQFNEARHTNVVEISDGFRKTMEVSLWAARETGGVFDPSLAPLINLWGFGEDGSTVEVDPAELAAAKERCGWEKIELSEAGLRKTHPDLELNLSAVAKGFAVDAVSDFLTARGYANHYVEIGGEVVCRGYNASRKRWRIGIQEPSKDAPERPKYVVFLDDSALATSGDYRNFLIVNGQEVAHIIDPRTGEPAGHKVASVSVLAKDCATADAIATALYVMGDEEGLKWVEAREGIEAMFLVREKHYMLKRTTVGFDEKLQEWGR